MFVNNSQKILRNLKNVNEEDLNEFFVSLEKTEQLNILKYYVAVHSTFLTPIVNGQELFSNMLELEDEESDKKI